MNPTIYPGFDYINHLLTAHGESVLFYALALMAIPLAYGVVFDTVIIRSGFLLIGVFGTIAGLFYLLHAPFLALAQLLIYAVAITLVVVIALMLTNPKMENDPAKVMVQANKLPGVITAIAFFMVIYLALRSELWPISSQPIQGQSLKVLGYFLMTSYSLPFEFASILLLIALVGAIMLAKAEPAPEAEQGNSAVMSDGRTDDVKV